MCCYSITQHYKVGRMEIISYDPMEQCYRASLSLVLVYEILRDIRGFLILIVSGGLIGVIVGLLNDCVG